MDVNECVICKENFENNDICTTKCGHKFHTSCLFKIKGSNCPLCRDTISEQEINSEYEMDGEYAIENGKCIGKSLDNNFIMLCDKTYKIEYQQYKMERDLIGILNLEDVKLLIERCNFKMTKKGLISNENGNIIGKISKNCSIYTINTDEKIINREQFKVDCESEINSIKELIKSNGNIRDIKNRIDKLSLVYPSSINLFDI